MANDNNPENLSITSIFTKNIMLANEKALNVEDAKQTKEVKKVSAGISKMGQESKTKAKEEKRERESFMLNLLEGFQDAFLDAKSEMTQPFKDTNLTGIVKLLLLAVPALAAGIVAGIFGQVGSIMSKLPGVKKINSFFQWIANIKWGKWLTVFSKGGRLQKVGTFFKALGKFFRVIGKILKPFIEIGKFVFKFIAPQFKHMGKIFKVFFQLGKAFSKFLLPISIIWSLVEATIRSWDKFASGDILGGIGDFIGSIIEFFTFGLISMDDFSAVFEGIFGNLISGFQKLFSGDITGALEDLGQFLLNWMVGMPELVMDSVLGLLETVMGWIGLDGAAKFFKDLKDINFVDLIGDFFGNIGSTLKSRFNLVMGLVAIPIEAVGDFFSWIFTQLKKSINNVINMLTHIPWIGDDIADAARDMLGLGGDVQSVPSNTGLELQRENTRLSMADNVPTIFPSSPTNNNNLITHIENNSFSQPPMSSRNDYNPHIPSNQW